MINPLIVEAAKKARQVRRTLGLDLYEPINIFDACIKLGLTVRFIDVNMEGMYIYQNDKNATILLSTQRPFSRRCFTCAHELGHHVFGHGTKVDALTDEKNGKGTYNREELLVDMFAGELLMPSLGIQAELIKRNWDIGKITPLQVCIICGVFGVGYRTLITHCKVNNLIDEQRANSLLKLTPAKILQDLLGTIEGKSHFKIIDEDYTYPLIDIEVLNYLIVPQNIKIKGNHLRKLCEIPMGVAYVAEQPGIIRISSDDNINSFFVRIQNFGYIGLAENRHLETINE